MWSIGSAGSPTVTLGFDVTANVNSISVAAGASLSLGFDATANVNSISVAAGASLSLGINASLTVEANSTINGDLSMTNASLEASGTGVDLDVSGATTVSNSEVEVGSAPQSICRDATVPQLDFRLPGRHDQPAESQLGQSGGK